MIRAVICLAGLLVSAQAGAEWHYEEVMDDSAGATAYLLQADSSIAVKGSDGKEHHPSIQLRCDGNGGKPYWRIRWFAIVDTEISSSSGRNADDDVRLQVRVDGKADYSDAWDMSRDESLESVFGYLVNR